MKQTRIDPEAVWKEYASGKAYNARIGLYDRVRQNEDFYLGRQWEGLEAPDLEQPVLNFLKRAVNYFVSMLVSDDVSAVVVPRGETASAADEAAAEVINAELARVLERVRVQSLHRDLLRNVAVDGDGVFYLHFSPATGEIEVENLDNTKVLFGNPYQREVQKQPYILLVKRELAENVSRRCGFEVAGDSDPDGGAGGENADTRLVTVLTRLWRDERTGTIHMTQVTRDAVLRPETDTGCRLYPIAWMCWENVKSSYHGQAAISGLIPNQIAVNRLMALAIHNEKMTAFPKILYNAEKIDSWSNRVGEAIAVNGTPGDAVATSFRAADMSGQVTLIIKNLIDWTKELMGASDAALGSVRPDNTSAIIAVQKAASQPLELQKLSFFRFVEEYVHIMLDLMHAYYGIRRVRFSADGEGGRAAGLAVDFAQLLAAAPEIRVDVGSSPYWNELTQVQTLDNLFTKGIIRDAVTYLEQLPDKYVRNKNKLIEKLKALPETTAV